MLKEYTTVSIGVLTLLVAAFAAYGITNMNTEIQATKPDPIQVPDYSEELSAISTQIQSIKNELVALKEVKSDVLQIQQKLVALEQKIPTQTTQPSVQQIAFSPQQLMLNLGKTTYSPGETLQLIASGIESQKFASIQILDSDGFVIINKDTWSDSLGKIMYQIKLSDAMIPGIYQVKIISEGKIATEQIRVVRTSESSNSIPVESYVFSVQSNKSQYHQGDIIEISGTGKPNTQISAVLTSPSGKTYSTNSSTQNDGKFLIFFSTNTNFEDGKWYVTASHLSKSIVVSITID